MLVVESYMAQILVVDDDELIGGLVHDGLRLVDHDVDVAIDAESALLAAARKKPDLCILDVNLPGLDGYELLAKLRSHYESIPIVFLTARDNRDDVALGFRMGADDYIRKPFVLEELVLRINAVLRRSQRTVVEGEVSVGRLRFDAERHLASVDGDPLSLSATEFGLLEELVTHAGKVRTRSTLLREVWGIEFDSETSVVETYISYLRRKIHRDGFEPIVTIRGVGYKFRSDS